MSGIDARVEIPAGDLESSDAVDLLRLTAVDNDVWEGDKQVTVHRATWSTSRADLPVEEALLTIRDDESPSELRIRDGMFGTFPHFDPSTNVEPASGTRRMAFLVDLERRNEGTPRDVTVAWETAARSATAGKDYEESSGTVTFRGDRPGLTSFPIWVPVFGDTVDEAEETFVVILSNPTEAVIARGTGVGRIEDSDGPPTVTLHLEPDSITENGGVSTVTASLSHPSGEDTTVTVSVAPTSSAALPAMANDHTLSGTSSTIPAGETDSTGLVTITATDNAVIAPDKEVTLSATARNTLGIEGQPDDVILTIVDDDKPRPTVTVERVASPVAEGADARFRVRRRGVTAGALTVAYRVSESGAMVAAGEEGARTVAFADGDTVKTVPVPTENDSFQEADSAVTLMLTAGLTYDLGTSSSATVTVQDDDAPLPPALVTNLERPTFGNLFDRSFQIRANRPHSQSFQTGSAARGYILEGIALNFYGATNTGIGRLTVTLRANSPDGSPGNVLHTLTNPSRVDFDGLNEFIAPASVILAADTWYHVVAEYSNVAGPWWGRSKSGVDPGSAAGWEIGDRYEESSGGGSWASHSSRVSIAVRGTAVPLPTVTVERVASPVAEGEDAQFKVRRRVYTRETGALTVNYRVSETGDMVAPGEEGAKTVAFGDGVTEVTVAVPTMENTVHEADSTVTLTLTADAAYDLGTDDTANVTVEDDDNAVPTGVPTIDDMTPVVGEMLRADASGIADADGLTAAVYTYQWARAAGGTETPIAGATMASYTVGAGDVGATLKVAVSFTDDDGTVERVESAATAVARPPLPMPAALVSNMDKHRGDVSAEVRRNISLSQRFETGSVARGYGLDSIFLHFGTDGDIGSGALAVTLRESLANGSPGKVLHTLANPSRVKRFGRNEFTAPPGVRLAAGTRYHVVFEYSSNNGPPAWSLAEPGLDSGAAEGWGIPADRLYRKVGDGTWERLSSVLAMAVRGYAIPDDPSPTVTVAPVAVPVAEGEDAQFRVTRTGVTAGALTVHYRVSETGDIVASGEEGAQTVDFTDGDAAVTVSVPTEDDSAWEADSTVTVTLTADAALQPGAGGAAVGGSDGRRRRQPIADGRGDDRRHDARGGPDTDGGRIRPGGPGRSDGRDLHLAVDPGVG